MVENSDDREAFNGCLNRHFRLRGAIAEVVCVMYPDGGAKFDKDHADRSPRRTERALNILAQRLGCAACPYADEMIARVLIEHTDEAGRQAREMHISQHTIAPTE
jgi:hypothetical protein